MRPPAAPAGGGSRPRRSSARATATTAVRSEKSTATIAPRIPRCAVQRRIDRAGSRCADRGVVGRAGREPVDPVVQEQERAAGLAAEAPAAQVARGGGRPAGCPGRRRRRAGTRDASPVLLGEEDEPPVGVDELAERRQRRGAVEDRGAPSRPVRRRPASISAGGTYGSKTTRRTSAGGGPGSGGRPQLLVERLGPQLAQRVAEVGPPPAAQVGGAHPAGEPVRRAQAARADRLGHLVAGHPLGPQVGPHPPRGRVAHPGVHVEQQGADAGVELTGDAVALVGEEPPRLVGRRVGVVRPRRRPRRRGGGRRGRPSRCTRPGAPRRSPAAPTGRRRRAARRP